MVVYRGDSLISLLSKSCFRRGGFNWEGTNPIIERVLFLGGFGGLDGNEPTNPSIVSPLLNGSGRFVVFRAPLVSFHDWRKGNPWT